MFQASYFEQCSINSSRAQSSIGKAAPSREDVEVTKRLVESGKILGIDVLDHIVLGDGEYVSLKEKGHM